MRAFVRLLALLALIATPTFVTEAHAASIVCPTDIGYNQPIWNNVTPNTGPTGCELGGTNNDSATQVNADSMFDITSWVLLAGEEANYTSATLCADPDSDPDNCDNSTGWVYPAGIESLMLVLKDGNGEPEVYVGYLIDGLPSIIDILYSPFLNDNNTAGNPKEISHWNLYWSEDGDNTVTEVPEPASLLLVGGGLLAAARRRRNKR